MKKIGIVQDCINFVWCWFWSWNENYSWLFFFFYINFEVHYNNIINIITLNQN